MTATTITVEQLDAMLERVKSHRTDANLQALRDANGITTTGTVTAQAVRIIKLRVRQGYSMNEIAMMVGLSRSSCFNVKAGRRGRSCAAMKPCETTFKAAIGGAPART